MFTQYVFALSSGPVETRNVTFGSVGDGSSEDVRNVTIHWDIYADYPNQTFRSVLTVHPMDASAPNIEFTGTSELREKGAELNVSLGVLLGINYTLYVRSNNCGDRQKGNTVTKSLLLNGMLCVYVHIVPVPVYGYIHVYT